MPGRPVRRSGHPRPRTRPRRRPSRFEEAATGLAAADAQVVLHVTGEGVPTGHSIVPVVKISAGVDPLSDGDTTEVEIEGVGTLVNEFTAD